MQKHILPKARRTSTLSLGNRSVILSLSHSGAVHSLAHKFNYHKFRRSVIPRRASSVCQEQAAARRASRVPPSYTHATTGTTMHIYIRTNIDLYIYTMHMYTSVFMDSYVHTHRQTDSLPLRSEGGNEHRILALIISCACGRAY